MNNKLVFLIVVLALLFGLIFIISKNRKDREKVRIEEKTHFEQQQYVQDSLQKIYIGRQQYVQDSLQNVRSNNDLIRNNSTINTTSNSLVVNSPIPSEDFSSYINSSISNSSGTITVAVTILDRYGNVSSSLSSSIADIYSQTDKSGITGLLRNSFIQKSSFQELFEGNSDIIDKLKLSRYTDYVAIGKISYSTRKGTLVDDTFVCMISLTMNIISANQKWLVKSFTCTANGNGATEDQAREYAIDKLLSKYISEYSAI